ncbi:hypothetical protein NDU88_011073 [Pleurodeles waltl]|uniref:UPAR/Ly6 domain-containing protein n=2 Tax=Pleurodeles waltl TaxID=8319 RepID=A0AAV7Q409_PLEWA|nr:hypothetical protein NDU88_011073 [Pleurodeles waltl]
MKTCTSLENTCLTAYSEVIGGGVKTEVLLRTCAQSISCKQTYSYSSPQMSMRIATACCSTDGCIPAHRPALPLAPAKPNGVRCPWCFEEQSQACSKQVTRICTGEETKCLHSTTNVTTEYGAFTVAMSGCATENLCIAHQDSNILEGLSVVGKLQCTNGAIHPQHGYFLPVLVGVVLLKYCF